jgi:hypothetical protein
MQFLGVVCCPTGHMRLQVYLQEFASCQLGENELRAQSGFTLFNLYRDLC